MSLCKVELEPTNKIRIAPIPEGMARVIYSRNPFDTNKHTHEFKEIGEQLFLSDAMSKEMLALPEESVVASINGDIIQKADWNESLVGEGDVVVIFEVPGGGGDDDSKAILRIVAMIIVVIASQGAASNWAASLGWGSFGEGVLAIGLTIAGSLIVNAILPPIAPDAPTDYGFEDSKTYGIDGAKNTSDEGTPLPVCYGPFRMAGNIINYHTRNQGNDQYLYLLLNAGEGVSAGLSLIELNEQDIAGFLDAEVKIRLGDSDPTAIDWFSDTISPTSIGSSVTETFQTRTTSGPVDSFRLDFVAPQGLVEYRDDGSRRYTAVVFEIEYKKTSEPTVWTALTSQGLVTTEGWVYRYYEYNTYDAEGNILTTVPQEDRSDFRDVGDYLKSVGTPYSMLIFSSDNRIVGVRYRVPAYATTLRINKAQASAVRFSFYSPTLDEDTYNIRVRRTTVESTDPKIRDAITWTDLNEIILEDVLYKHTALLGLKIRLTDQLSSFPTVTYLNSGRIIRFWDTTNQVWDDGPSTNPAWIVYDAYTNSRFGGDIDPARIDIDAWKEWGEYCDTEGLTFQGVFDTKSNLWDATMHVYRAGHARPIKMGTQYSVAIDRATAPSQMFTVGNIIKGSFNQKWMSLTDRANEIELHYFDETDRFKRRTIKVYDAITLADSPQNTASAIMYGIVDATRAAEEATYLLLNNRYLKSVVNFKAPMEAVAVVVGDVFVLQHDQPEWAVGGRLVVGSTTTSMAVDKTVTFDGAKLYKFMARFDSLTRDVATITAIVGKKLTLSGFAGATNINRLQLTLDNAVDRRITRVDTDTVWVDDATGLTVTDSVDLIEIDAIEIRDVVVATSGDLTSVPLVTAMPIAPAEHVIYMVGEDTLLESEWRVTKIDVDKDLAVAITGATYDERIYDWTPLTNQPAPDTGNNRVVPHVINLSVVQSTVNIGGILRPVIDISWDLPPDFDDYGGVLIELSEAGAGYRFEKIHRGDLRTTIEYSFNTTVDVRVVAMSIDGRFALNSTAPEVTGLSLSGDTIAPAVPTSVAIALGTIGLHVSWVNAVDADLAGCDIKRNTVDNEGAATIIFTTDKVQVSFDDVRATTAANSYFYWMRSVDNNGNGSAWVASTPTSLQPTAFADGADATTGWLTNEHHGIIADADGGNPVFSEANGEFKVWKSTTDITETCTFSVFAADNLTGTINTALNTPVPGPQGYYEVTAETVAQDIHSFVVRAVTPDSITIDRVFTVAKNKAGADGTPAKTVILSAESQTFAYDKSSGTPVLIGPTTIALTINEQNTTGATTWAAWDDTGAAITPVTLLLSSVTDAGATILESAFDAITNNDFVKVRATREGIYDEISIHSLGSGVDGLNRTPAFIYQRTTADSAPAVPSVQATYTFATGAISGLNNGWTDTIPSFTGSNPYLWITKAFAEGTTPTDFIETGEWQNPAEKLSENGAPGGDGFNTATLTAYKRLGTVPTDDPGASIEYTFDGALWTPGNGWTYYIPAGTLPVYALSATAYGQGPTDDVLSADWSAPQLILQDGTDGEQGISGLNTAVVYIYQRTTTQSAPPLPSVTANFTFDTGNVINLNNGWTDTIPAITGPWPHNPYLWVTIATASSINANDDILATEWQDPPVEMAVGGTDGYNTATLNAFKKQATAPTDDPGAITYTFATAAWTPGNGWTTNIPLGNNPVFTVSAVARSQEATDDVAAVEWSAVTQATNVSYDATAYIYQRTLTDVAPTLPSVTATYAFDTGAITNLNNGWTDTIPAAGSNPYLWVSLARAINTILTDDILSTEWQAAVHLAEDGAQGDDGYNTATLTAYKRAAVAPTDDPGVSITYTFETAAWTPLNSWQKTIPAGSNPLYAVSATARSQTATDDVPSAEWSAPTLVMQDGGVGDDGLNVATAYIYQRTATDVAPDVPSVQAEFTFSTGNILYLDNGWTDTVPAASANPFLWISLATASSITATDTIETGEWQTPQHLAEDGATGDPGVDGVSVYITPQNKTIVSDWLGDNYTPLPSGTIAQFKVFDGATDVTDTAGAVYSVVGTMPQNNLIIDISTTLGTKGEITISESVADAWSTDVEVFTLRCVYNTVTYDLEFALMKAKKGQQGIQGDDGIHGTRTGVLDVYKWSASAPTTFPSGTSTYTWATGQFTDPATLNGWSRTIPSVVPGQTLYILRQVEANNLTTTETVVTWTADATNMSEISLGAVDGANGSRYGFLEVYKWGVTAGTLPAGTSTYTWADGTFTAPSTPNGWSLTPGAAVPGQTLWGKSEIYVDTDTSPTDVVTWSGGSDYPVGYAGDDGIDGYNTATITAYQRAAAQPTVMPTDGLTYTFADPSLWTPGGLWSKTIPAYTTDPIWAVSATAFSDTAIDTVATADWSTAVQMAEDGVDGGAGLNVATVYIYQRTATDSAPAVPTTASATFVFADGTMDAVNNGWTRDIPTAGANDYLWVTFATASAAASTDEILAAEWQSPAEKLSETGAPGADAQLVKHVTIYRYNSATISSGSGTFANPLAGNTSWQYAVPALINNGDYVSVSSRIFTDDGQPPHEAAWSTVARYSQRTDGDTGGDGPTGQAVRVVNMYRKNSSALPDNLGTFAIPISTANAAAGWSQNIQSITANLDVIWVRSRTYTDDTNPPQDATWSAAAKYAERIDGVAGVDGLVVAGVKIDTKTFTFVSSPGDMYVHGYSNGVIADVPGSLLYNGSAIAVPNDYINTSQHESQGYIVFDMLTASFSMLSPTRSVKMAACKMSPSATLGQVQWQYDNNSVWVDFTPDADMIIIGTYETSAANNIATATIVSPMTLSSQHITAGKIEVAQLSALTSIIGQLDTRATGIATNPRLRLSDTASPLQIFRPDDDTTVIFGVGDDGSGDAAIVLRGDFVPDSLGTADAYSTAGIDALASRLGLSGGGAGGHMSFATPVGVTGGPTTKQLTVGSPIVSAGKDMKLVFQFTDNDSGIFTTQTRALWTIKWQVRVDSGTWVDVSGASYNLIGQLEDWEDWKGLFHYEHFLNATRSFDYTPVDGDSYEFRISYERTSGSDFDPTFESAYADEPSGVDLAPGMKPAMFIGSGSLTLSGSTSWKTMDLTTETYDPDNNYTISADVITVLSAGYYEITYDFNFDATGGATNDSIGCRITKNGTTSKLTGSESRSFYYKANTRPSSVCSTFIALLAANDTIRLQQNSDQAGGITGIQKGTNTSLVIKKVRNT